VSYPALKAELPVLREGFTPFPSSAGSKPSSHMPLVKGAISGTPNNTHMGTS